MDLRAVVVIPTRNELATIAEIIARVLEQAPKVAPLELHVLVVDGASTDGTTEYVTHISQEDPRVHLLVEPRPGLGLALLEAHRYAIERLDAAYIAQMDADLSHNPDVLPDLLLPLTRGSDLTIGSRYVPGGGTEGWPWTRRLESSVANNFIRFATGHRELKEWTSGYRAFTVSLYQRLDIPSITYADYTVQPALVYAALKTGARVTEVPILFVNRRWGKSKLPLVGYTFHLLRHFTRRHRRPEAATAQTWPVQAPD
jgi:dolichol-phosphate mannosyltransferase